MRVASLLLAGALLLPLGCSSSDDASTGGPTPIAWTAPQAEIELSVLANGGVERLVMATFLTGEKLDVICTSESVGGCEVRTCSKGGELSAGTKVDPGAVTVSSASFGDATPMSVDATGYGRIVQMGDLPPGEEVRVTATGSASLPAFDLKVRAAAMLEPKTLGNCGQRGPDVTACQLTDAAPVATWTGGSKVVTVSLAPALDLPTKTTLRCAFDGAAGKGQLPAAALAKLAGDQAHTVSVVGYDDAASTPAGSTPSVALTSMRWTTTKGLQPVRLKR